MMRSWAVLVTSLGLALPGAVQDHAPALPLLEASAALPFTVSELPIHLPAGQEVGKISWIAPDPRRGLLWLMQRGPKAPPVMAVDAAGQVVHAFGQGLYTIPHAIRLDQEGNVWTVDAGNSQVIEFTAEGKELRRIDAGTPEGPLCRAFCGTTDIAFGPKGRLFITDGYGNARVLEYTAEGKKVREWGTRGTAAGEFHLPHSIVIGSDGTIYVADRENGRVERFDLDGKYLGQIAGLGRTYSLALGSGEALWASMAPLEKPTGAPGWIVKLDGKTGKVLGYVPVNEEGGLHTVAVDTAGDPITAVGNRVLIFRKP